MIKICTSVQTVRWEGDLWPMYAFYNVGDRLTMVITEVQQRTVCRLVKMCIITDELLVKPSITRL